MFKHDEFEIIFILAIICLMKSCGGGHYFRVFYSAIVTQQEFAMSHEVNIEIGTHSPSFPLPQMQLMWLRDYVELKIRCG